MDASTFFGHHDDYNTARAIPPSKPQERGVVVAGGVVDDALVELGAEVAVGEDDEAALLHGVADGELRRRRRRIAQSSLQIVFTGSPMAKQWKVPLSPQCQK